MTDNEADWAHDRPEVKIIKCSGRIWQGEQLKIKEEEGEDEGITRTIATSS